MTLQGIFTRVATHLLTQNEKSQGGTGCAYRGPGHLKCAAGCLIPDELYRADLEQKSVANKPVADVLVAAGVVPAAEVEQLEFRSAGPVRTLDDLEDTPHLHLIMKLQNIHDLNSPQYWEAELRALAAEKGLVMP